MERASPHLQILQFLDWLHSTGVHLYDLALNRRNCSTGQAVFLHPKTTLAGNLNREEVIQRLSWLRAENSQHADIYFRPARHNAWPLIFLDDLSIPLAHKVTQKYSAAIIETSYNSCHLWLALSKTLLERERYEAQCYLVNRLKGQADAGSVSGEHWGRMPGFRNWKPSRNCWVNLRVLSKKRLWNPIFAESTTQNRCYKTKNRQIDHSRNEWGWVMGALENGMSPHEVVTRLKDRAMNRRGERDATRYASLTVRKACQKLGIGEA